MDGHRRCGYHSRCSPSGRASRSRTEGPGAEPGHFLARSLQTELETNPLGTARHMSPLISVGGDMTSVDPTLLRGREVSHLHPTIFARDDAEFGVLSNHADSSR